MLEHRAGRTVLVVPLRWRTARTSLRTGADDREDLFSPVDGFAPALGFTSTIFDHGKFNHTVIDGYASYKFGREDPGYSLGIERPFFGGPRLFVGAEMHDVSATDDLWRLTTIEQTLVSVGFKNSFRDYYHRRGGQLFATFQAGQNNELSVMTRWDRHEPLANAPTSASFVTTRSSGRIRSVVDQTRQLVGARVHVRHAADDGARVRAAPTRGICRTACSASASGSSRGCGSSGRPSWPDHGLGGDARFDRHIFNLRGYLAFSDGSCSRGGQLFGMSNGDLPLERQFALGGIGTIHGYAFKEVSGTGMALMNGEYRVRLIRGSRGDHDMLAVFGFYDAGTDLRTDRRVEAPIG